MPKTISVSEAKNRLSAILEWAVEHEDEVVVESRGEPKAVIMAYGEYEALLDLRANARRQAALQRLEEIATQARIRNADLSEEDVEQLAEEVSQETIRRMVEKGDIQFRP